VQEGEERERSYEIEGVDSCKYKHTKRLLWIEE